MDYSRAWQANRDAMPRSPLKGPATRASPAGCMRCERCAASRSSDSPTPPGSPRATSPRSRTPTSCRRSRRSRASRTRLAPASAASSATGAPRRARARASCARRSGCGVVRGGTAFGYDYVALAHKRLAKRMDPFIFTFPSRMDHHAFFEHDGEEFVFILSGSVVFQVGDERWTLAEGDSLYFDAEVPHRGWSVGREARALVVVSARETGTVAARRRPAVKRAASLSGLPAIRGDLPRSLSARPAFPARAVCRSRARRAALRRTRPDPANSTAQVGYEPPLA